MGNKKNRNRCRKRGFHGERPNKHCSLKYSRTEVNNDEHFPLLAKLNLILLPKL